MIFVIGGVASGKRSFVEELGYRLDDESVLIDLQELMRDDDIPVPELVAKLADKKIITCAETGSGVVPAAEYDAAWRERVGRVSAYLAHCADTVVRMVCGIPVVLKGALVERQPVELIIIRHGATAHNEQRRYSGSSDLALSEVGQMQTRSITPHPEIKRVYVSPLARARQSAAILFPNAQQLVVEDLQEMDFGPFEGHTADEMAHDADYRAWVDSGCTLPIPGGESRALLIARVNAALDKLVLCAEARGERRIIIVAHGGTIMSALHAHFPSERDYFDWACANCEGYAIDVSFEGGLPIYLGYRHITNLEDALSFALEC